MFYPPSQIWYVARMSRKRPIAIISLVIAAIVLCIYLYYYPELLVSSIESFSRMVGPEMFSQVVISAIVVVVAILIDGISRSAIANFCKRADIEEHVENALKLLSRIVIGLSALAFVLGVFGLSIGWLVGAFAFTGVAVGFATRQTLGNLLAGLYVIVTRPFAVEDYVKIGDIEGQVKAISISYTELYTPSYNMMKIPNDQVLGSKILNYTKDDTIEYLFDVSFPHTSPVDVSYNETKKGIASAIDDVFRDYKDELVKKPEFSASDLDRLKKAFSIRIFISKEKVDLLYDLKSKLVELITDKWDTRRAE